MKYKKVVKVLAPLPPMWVTQMELHACQLLPGPAYAITAEEE